MKKLLLIFFIISIIFIAGCSSKSNGIEVTVFKSPSCGCCVGYSSFLEQEGYEVEIVETNDMASIKQKYGIPRQMESCHTTIIGDYFVEGHVPKEALEKLLTEKPAIDGIALPNMPAGTPGMPGVKKEPYRIFSLNNGEITDFVII